MPNKPTYEELEKRIKQLEAEHIRYVQMENKLKRNLQFTESLLESIPTPIFFKDAQGRYMGCNPAFSELMGVTTQEILGKTVQELWPSEQASVYHQKDLDLIEKPGRQIYEFEVKDKHGKNRPVIFSKNAFYNENGEVAGLVGGFVDITDRKQAEEALRESERLLRVAGRTSRFGGWSAEPDGQRVVWSNQVALIHERESGYSPTVEEAIHYYAPEWREKITTLFQTCALHGAPYDQELEIITARGCRLWVRTTGEAIRDSRGEIIRVQGSFQDITDRKQAEENLKRSEGRLRQAQHMAKLGYWDWEMSSNELTWSNEVYAIFGRDMEKFHLTGKSFEDCIHPDDYQNFLNKREVALAEHRSIDIEHRINLPDGTIRHVQELAEIIRDDDGNVVRVSGTVQDITERVKVEEMLRKSETKYRKLFEKSLDAIFIVDKQSGRYLDANQAGEKLTGRSLSELKKVTTKDVTPQNAHQRMKHIDLLNESTDFGETIYLQPDGTKRIAELVSVPLDDKTVYGIAKDITERKESEEEIKQSEIKYRSIFNNKSTGTGTFGEDGIITSVNSKITELIGYTEEEIVGRMKWSDLVDEKDLPRLQSYHSERAKMMDNPPPIEYECTVKHKNGTRKNIVANIGMTGDLRVVSLIDITERVKAEQALKESEGRFRALHDASFGGIAIHDKGIILECNNGLSEMTGYDYKELIGMNGLLHLISDDTREQVFKNISTEYEKPYEANGVRKNGEIYPMRLEARNIPYKGKDVRVVEFRDLTEMKRMEAQLQQSQKMEAIGTLAGGIAHDFNNILSGIFGYSQLAEMNINNPERAKSDIKNIVKGASRATELVQQILTFSRKADYEKQYLNLFVIVKEVLKLIRSTIPAAIAIKEKINSNASIYADPIQMHQVIMNLCTNAYHAMEDSGGELTVRLDETHMPLLNNESMINVDQKYLELEISDTGHGMDENTIKKIFDPYFTTKNMEKGTGLGLALVRAIVEEHSGTIKVNSIVSKGSTFLLHFPVSEKKKNTKNETSFEKKIPTGTESILFVDDEMGIRSFVRDFLCKYGYAVTVSENGQKAYEQFRQAPQNFDIVITDMAMPK